ncbi:hypothetical protein SAMN05444156_0619 [Verrucomicrobium sp. GAS474]|uniref:hypothetical protein n=1 Tax=Verrucomicrobium sp. GAS474 TaxID=1882831 RepID=UPI00087BB1C9|nr:hypothetical protein [Verrucomicrobium sp. GAS474]SDT90645.1 hypothetical protein SAMN05444156_0619 [Verrucomicrobium sp. GAS474]
MEISDFVPTLQPMAEQISTDLRFVCFFVLTASIIVRASRTSHGNVVGLMKPIITAAVLCGLIATLPVWFNAARDEFWNIAVLIRSQFADDPTSTSSALMKLIKPPDNGFNWLDIGNSLMKAVQFALGWLVVCIGGMVQLPMMIGQFVMECLCYMFLPIALSLFSMESTKGLGMRYVQQTLAILAWPIGFAVVDLVGYSILTGPISAGSALALAYGAATKFTPATLLLGCITAVWLILGSLAVPIVMQLLFCSGTPLSSSVGKSIELGMAAGGISRLLSGKLGAAPSSSGPSSPGTPGSSNGPSSSPPTPPSPTPAGSGMPPQLGTTQQAALMPLSAPVKPQKPPPSSDPSLDRFALAVKQLNQIPLAISY